MLADSHLQDLEQHAISPNGEPFCVYGDPASYLALLQRLLLIGLRLYCGGGGGQPIALICNKTHQNTNFIN